MIKDIWKDKFLILKLIMPILMAVIIMIFLVNKNIHLFFTILILVITVLYSLIPLHLLYNRIADTILFLMKRFSVVEGSIDIEDFYATNMDLGNNAYIGVCISVSNIPIYYLTTFKNKDEYPYRSLQTRNLIKHYKDKARKKYENYDRCKVMYLKHTKTVISIENIKVERGDNFE